MKVMKLGEHDDTIILGMSAKNLIKKRTVAHNVSMGDAIELSSSVLGALWVHGSKKIPVEEGHETW